MAPCATRVGMREQGRIEACSRCRTDWQVRDSDRRRGLRPSYTQPLGQLTGAQVSGEKLGQRLALVVSESWRELPGHAR